MKDKKKQLLADSLNNAINLQQKPKEDLSKKVNALLEDYRDPENVGHSKTSDLDTQKPPTWTPKNKNTDTQKPENLSAIAPNIEAHAPKNLQTLDAYAPKNKTLDTQKKYDYRKYDAKRTTVRVNLHIDKRLDQEIREYCVKANPRLELKTFFELAARRLLDTQKDETLSANAPYDDRRLMISWKTKTPIINLYLRYNAILNQKPKWTVNDDEKANHLNNVDLRIIELGIIQTQFQKGFKGKINSFSYYLNEINNFLELEMTGEVLETMIKINRQRWQQMTGKTIELD